MKKTIIFIATTIFMMANLQAQAPEKFNYQGIARDNTGTALANQALGLRISIINSNNAAMYVETHNATTNAFGLYQVAVGEGTPVTGSMSAIIWESGGMKIKVEIDPNGGTNYTSLGTTELLSVPYALYTNESGARHWSLSGNAVGPNDFIGTVTNQDLRFKVHDMEAGVISAGMPNNTALGQEALKSNTTGQNNSAFGDGALFSNTTGEGNTAVGQGALADVTTTNNNTAVGEHALADISNGTNNTAIGNLAGHLLSGGSNNNTLLGVYTSVSDGVDYAMAIGETATVTTVDHIVLGTINTTQIGGYEPWSVLSDIYYKKDIKPIANGLDFIMKLEPITYHVDAKKIHDFINNIREDKIEETPELAARLQKKSSELRSGFSAQQVESAAQAVGYDFSGINPPENERSHYTLEYATFVVPLVKAVQEQQHIIQTQQKTIAQQQTLLQSREMALKKIRQRLTALEMKIN